MGQHQNELDARAREALAEGRRRAVLAPQIDRAQWRSETDPKWAAVIAAFRDRCETGDSEGFWQWPETKAIQAFLDERVS